MARILLILLLLTPIWGMAQPALNLDQEEKRLDSLEQRHQTEAQKGDFKTAVETFKIYAKAEEAWETMQDSLTIAQLSDSLQLRERQAEIELTEIKTANQRRWIAWLMGAIFVVAGTIILVYRLNQQRFKQEQAQHELEAQIEAAALEAQSVQLAETQLITEQLSARVNLKNQQLSGRLLHSIHHNRLLREIGERLKQHPDDGPGFQALQEGLQQQPSLEEEWLDFLEQFESLHPNVFGRIKEQGIDLTTGEQKLIALSWLQLSSKEMATLLGISPDSVKTSRSRLSRKLSLEKGEKLTDYLMGL